MLIHPIENLPLLGSRHSFLLYNLFFLNWDSIKNDESKNKQILHFNEQCSKIFYLVYDQTFQSHWKWRFFQNDLSSFQSNVWEQLADLLRYHHCPMNYCSDASSLIFFLYPQILRDLKNIVPYYMHYGLVRDHL